MTYDQPMRELAISRLVLIILCVSYLLSAVLLTWARIAGQVVPIWKIGGWAVLGIAGFILLRWLSPDRPVVSVAMFVVLAPWMVLALYEDTRLGHYVIAIIDFAGLVAIGYALWLIRKPLIT